MPRTIATIKDSRLFFKAYLGIDPGKTGALCLYLPGGETYKDNYKFLDWPKSNNPREIIDKLQQWSGQYIIKKALLEKVGAMPKQGVTSMFNFGQNYGMWQAILLCLKIPFVLQSPQTWRKGIILPSDGKDPKQANYNVALRLFPDIAHLLKGPRGGLKDGRVDSLLMAYKISQ